MRKRPANVNETVPSVARTTVDTATAADTVLDLEDDHRGRRIAAALRTLAEADLRERLNAWR